MAVEVDVSPVQSVPVAVVRRLARQSDLPRVIPAACGAVWDYVRATAFRETGRNVAIYRDGEINVEAGVEVVPPFHGNDDVILSATPEGVAAHATHIGPYAELDAAHAAIREWSRSTGRPLTGPSWEIYGHWTDDVTKLRTDVYYLVGRRRT